MLVEDPAIGTKGTPCRVLAPLRLPALSALTAAFGGQTRTMAVSFPMYFPERWPADAPVRKPLRQRRSSRSDLLFEAKRCRSLLQMARAPKQRTRAACADWPPPAPRRAVARPRADNIDDDQRVAVAKPNLLFEG